jgi:hypothetical protein
VPEKVERMANRGVRAASAVLFLILMSSLWCHSADVVLIRSAGGASSEQRELELATQFYGVNLTVVTASDNNAGSSLRAVRQNATLAVAIEANALALVNQEALLRALHREHRGSVPLLVLGVTPEAGPTLLSTWSGGTAVGAQRLANPLHLRYVVGRVAGITQQLTDLEIPFPGNDAFYFALAGHSKAQEIMAVRNDHQVVPVFIEADLHEQKVFLLCKAHPAGDSVEESPESIETAFAEIAPVMMFIRYSAGERSWHAVSHYANLIIDDPWLREPYGYLNYKGLLAEMERHNFHSTIAFIPWNYDRSEPEVVSLFRDHPDRFSICIHGDNHDHKEFTDYRSKPLAVQTAALKQALGRMDRFQMLTGIPYDKVLVFPHSIAPEKTLVALKTYNYLATVNSSNVPMDRPNPSLLPFALRPVTVEFANFASIRRYPVEVPAPISFIAMNEFLGNPLFFYCHHDFFASGIDAFDGVADQVNRLEPDTRWLSVGEIVRHLYLVRLRDDSGYDVLSFSSDFRLDNISGRDSIFYVRKQEAGRAAIRSVSVDGQDYPHRLQDGYLDLSIPISAGKARSVVIQYDNDLESAAIDISKNSVRAYLLRMASDLRDIRLPRYAPGRVLIALYYKHDVSRAGTLVCVSFLIVSCGWVAWRLRRTISTSGRMRSAGRRT